MAVKKLKKLDTGVDADYQRIVRMETVLDFRDNIKASYMLIAIYKDEASRLEGRPNIPPLLKVDFDPFELTNKKVTDIRDQLYVILKAKPEYEDATDILESESSEI